ncbi:cell wall metabolism sensor histidine kinase WalK [Paenibacillus sp. MDMC362]|uniref:sensor histidine kinase n=1 Tax=Paenibacillus sp. MDMC362 TaxID=2977365 RepID=UPI000DC3D21D|nr:HAMP domain-containing sensor histidine kinase [Paenibacillus sp. MDMC362]RAR41756.1 two-component sensor histidine kinase [Paenibacillus sp. MDMC362]
MKIMKLYSIRLKMLLMLLASIGITAALLIILYALSTLILSIPAIKPPLVWIINNIGSDPVMLVAGIILFLVSYYVSTKWFVLDLQKIQTGLQDITAGRFDSRIELRSQDELGIVASSINRMTDQLNVYLEEIRIGLREIAKGNFDTDIPVQSGSQLGEVAESINQMSRQLHQSILEERNAEKTKNDLITGVSHDLRTPLTSILGFLEVIEEDRYQDEVELRYYVNIAYEKAQSLKKLIDDLFEYTRINNGLPLDIREIDMAQFMRQLIEEFVPALEKAGLECKLAAEEGLVVRADGAQLVRAYENLISNAIRYGESGKRIDIAVRSEGNQVSISFTNYGDPIPERDLPFIFDRFYRVEASRSKQTGGTGLGLAITKSIVEVQGGEIRVRSDRQRTTFETRFPTVV